MSLATATHRILKRTSIRLFIGADKLGVHILPKHYYTSVPDHKWLRENKAVWCRRVDMSGVWWDLDKQLAWVREQCSDYLDEVRDFTVYSDATKYSNGLGYGPIESQVLHCVCRSLKPKRVIEVGCGVSTVCMLHALRLNAAETLSEFTLTCVDPFPAAAPSGRQGVEMVSAMVQALPLTFFDRLEAGDLLFIDSTHSVKTGSEVPYLYLEVLPRLKPGVVVHIHDVFLPYLYQPEVLTHYIDWQESALVLALLKGNANIRVLCCLSALHHDAPTQLETVIPTYRPRALINGLSTSPSVGDFPTSMWLCSQNHNRGGL